MRKKNHNSLEIENTGVINIAGPFQIGNNSGNSTINNHSGLLPQSGSSSTSTVDSQVVSRPALRKMIHEILRSDADFDAFCLDHFFNIHRQFTGSMQREQKINLLLLHADLPQVAHCLRTWGR